MFSIVVPAYNAAETIERCLLSAIGHPRSEVIVVDDGSTDGTEKIVREFERRRGVKLIVQGNLGATNARNRGLEAASGEFVLFLDSDDYRTPWTDGFRPTADLCLFPFVNEWPSGRSAPITPNEAFGTPASLAVLRGWIGGHFVPPVSVLWRAGFIRSIGGWNDEIRINQDGELMFRSLLKKPSVCFPEEMGFGVYVQHNGPRVSRARFEGRDRAKYDIIDQLEKDAAKAGVLDELRTDIALAKYQMARRLLQDGRVELGVEALRSARRLGLRGHRGSSLHVGLSSILGLRTKEAFARRLRSVRRAVGARHTHSTV